jgi:hypothetical protein
MMEWFYNQVFPYIWLYGAAAAAAFLLLAILLYTWKVGGLRWKRAAMALAAIVVILGWLNFVVSRVVAMHIGGYATRGDIKNGIHLVRNGDEPKQVSSRTYWRMYYYEYITYGWALATVAMLLASGAYLDRVRRRKDQS